MFYYLCKVVRYVSYPLAYCIACCSSSDREDGGDAEYQCRRGIGRQIHTLTCITACLHPGPTPRNPATLSLVDDRPPGAAPHLPSLPRLSKSLASPPAQPNSTAASLLYPTYASYKALRPAASVGRTPADQAAHLERWLMFWCVMGCVALWEQWAEWGVSW